MIRARKGFCSEPENIIEEVKALLFSPFAILALTFMFILAVVRGKRVIRVTLKLAGMQFSLDNYLSHEEGHRPKEDSE